MTTQAKDASVGATVLVVEDEEEVAGVILRELANFGFQTHWCRNGQEFKARLRVQAPDLILVDLGLPDVDGMSLVRAARERGDCGIIILTGRSHSGDRVMGLEDGADDYVTKPFDPRELVARVRSVLRRYARDPLSETLSKAHSAQFSGWTFHPTTNLLLSPEGIEYPLSNAEANLLQVFLERSNRILTREQLLGDRNLSPFDRSIDVRISRLRKKMEADPQNPKMIRTVYGAGYLFAAKVVWS